jgi:hypothetical protein
MSEKETLKKSHDEKVEEAVYKWYMQQCLNRVGVHGVEILVAAES